jgi:hypothetical protein
MDGMPHFGPFLRVGIHAPHRNEESLLQRLGARLLQLSIETDRGYFSNLESIFKIGLEEEVRNKRTHIA